MTGRKIINGLHEAIAHARGEQFVTTEHVSRVNKTDALGCLANQLRALFEPDGDVATPDPYGQSLAAMVIFLAHNSFGVRPNLGMDKNLFTLSWSPRRGAKLSITFINLEIAEWFGFDNTNNLSSAGKFHPRELWKIPMPFAAYMQDG